MKHGKLFLVVVGGALMISGCEKEDLVAPSPKSTGSTISSDQTNALNSLSRDSHGEYRRLDFRASFTTITVVLAPPPLLRLQITGIGQGTHIGRAEFVAYPTIDFTVPPPFPLSGTEVFTAADGDELFTSFTGHSAPPDPNGNTYITNTYTVTGGTGRFAGATGTLAGTAVAHAGSQNGSAVVDGTILVMHGNEERD